jgi:hypothetical protein
VLSSGVRSRGAGRFRLGLDEEGDLDDDELPRVRPDELPHAPTYDRVDDRLQVSSGIRIVEDEGGQCRPIDDPTRDDRRKPAGQRLESRPAGSQRLSGQSVGVDDEYPPGGERPADSGLAGTDTAGQRDDQTRLRRRAALPRSAETGAPQASGTSSPPAASSTAPSSADSDVEPCSATYSAQACWASVSGVNSPPKP